MAAVTVCGILEPKKINPVIASTFFPFICCEGMGPDAVILFFLGFMLKDLKEHPKRYVHFSLFGKKDKEDKKKIEN